MYPRRVVPGANTICSSLRHLGAEYLHQGGGVEAYVRYGKTMGIPLDDVGLPIHGVMPALLGWEVMRLSGTALTTRLRWTSGELLRLFPFLHELTVEATLASGALTIVTTLAPAGRESVPVSVGYHPYLRIPEEERSGWEVELGARGHLLLEPAVFEAAAGDGAVKVEFLGGYPYAQVYAPAHEDFICFEPMTAPANALVSGDGLVLVSPGETYRAAFRVSLLAGCRTYRARN